jgi:hypothetical protein
MPEIKGRAMRPNEMHLVKSSSLPPEILDIWNQVIAEAWTGNQAVVRQSDIKRAIQARYTGEFEFRFLDIEPIYEDAGWRVVYDKPAYCETYEPTFTFTKKRSR